MDISIKQIFGRIGISINNASISIHQERPLLFIDSTVPRIYIDSRPVRVEIDQTQCFNELGLKTSREFSRYMAEKARQKGMQAVAETAREGDFLAGIEVNRNAIPVLARKKTEKTVDLTIAALPRSRPEINFSGGAHISWQMGSVEVKAEYAPFRVSAARGRVDVYLIQKPCIEIDYLGRKIDKSI